MLKKSQRLTHSQFDEYFKSGKRFHFPHCTVVYTPHDSLQVAIVVGKKVSKLAVRRNTIRRRLYSVLRNELLQDAVTGVFIVLVKPTFTTLPRKTAAAEIQQNIATVLKKT